LYVCWAYKLGKGLVEGIDIFEGFYGNSMEEAMIKAQKEIEFWGGEIWKR
jgi:hypothetical protein